MSAKEIMLLQALPLYNPAQLGKESLLGATQKLLSFGTFGLNLDTEELRKDGTLIRLAPQPLRMLALLASHAGQVVTREEIQKQIWGDDTFVDFEHGMNQCINQIRSVLNDSADRPVYVETIPRRGYRFLAPVVSKTISVAPAVVESASSIELPPANSLIKPVSRGTPEASPAAAPQAEATQPAGVAAATAAPAPEIAPVRKAARPKLLLRMALVAAICIPVIVIGVYWSTRRVSALNEKDTIVLADFSNHTGDKVFDDSLKTALSFQLEQSPFLNVLSDQRAAGALRLMARPADQPVTAEVARELCLRTNSKAVIAGSIAAVGGHYLIGLKATNCQTGDTLVSAHAEAESLNKVLPALQQAGNELRTNLGESLASVRRFDQPLEEATTSSLDALQSFTQGRRIQVQGGGRAAIPHFERAIELDPSFAMAYLDLGIAYSNLNETKLAFQNLQKAYELRNRLTQRERLVIEAHYYGLATGDLDKAIQTATEWAQSYPGDYEPHFNLGIFNIWLGQYEKAATEMRESLRLAPADVDFSNLIGIYAALDQLDTAEAVLGELRARKRGGPYMPYEFWYCLAFLKHDDATMAQLLAWAIGKPGAEGTMLSVQSDTEAYRGRFASARDLSQRAVESSKRAGAAETAGGWRANEALREAEIGNFARARQQAAEALALSDGRSVRILAALALARAGDTVQAQKLADKLNQEAPEDTIIQGYWLPSIGAATELGKNSPEQAITALEPAAPYELGSQAPFELGPMYPVYLRGLALLQAGKAQAAAAEFQKMVDHPGIAGNFVLGPLAHLQLGRALVMTSDKVAARQAYQQFFTLWKDANSDIPILAQSKLEYAKLQ
jgi:DNA-binding winged helix-turn-helix (wHTH) protein/tetratricopeptide (TPR) repeat protein